jgi:A nuclease family of the HNH/ENDO VII superfamily with conserved AHH
VSGAVSDSKPNTPEARAPEVFEGPPPPSSSFDKVYGAGLAIGTLQGVTPFGTMIDGIQTSAGVGIQGPARYQLGKATGQAIGGLALMVLGSGGAIGGVSLNLTGIGAVIGVPATALSTGLVAAGAENALAGALGMWQAMSTGGLSGPVANGPAAPVPGAKPAPPPPPATGSQSKLAKAMRAQGMNQPANTDAHHIVAQEAKYAQKSREILQKFGIGIDEAVNGVFLPSNKSSPNPSGSAVHGPLHRKEYYNAVEEALKKASSKDEVVNILKGIRQSLESGGYP